MTKEELLQIISSNITDNNSGDITAGRLRTVLNAMVEYTPEMDNVNLDGYLYISTATPSTTPVTLTGDEKVFYIATEEGDYSNFGLGTISELSVIKSENGIWEVEGMGVPFKKQDKIIQDGYIIPIDNYDSIISVSAANYTIIGTNLIDKNKFKYQTIISDSGIEVADYNSSYYDCLIPVYKNYIVTLSFTPQRFYYYGKNGELLGRVYQDNVSHVGTTYTIPFSYNSQDIYFVKIQISHKVIGEPEYPQVNYGDSLLTYEDYKSNKSSLLYSKGYVYADNLDLIEIVFGIKSNGNYIVKPFAIPDVWEPADVDKGYSSPIGRVNTTRENWTAEKKYTYYDFLVDYYDIYLSYNISDYRVTKKSLGYDSSYAKENATTLYELFEYDFCPKNYSKVVMISAGMNAIETSGIWGLATFIKEVMKAEEPAMKYLKENVRFKILPFICPSSFDENPLKYENINGVRINKNFSYRNNWALHNMGSLKGGYPDSENETVILKKWMNDHAGIADLYIDCHSDAESTSDTYATLLTQVICSDNSTSSKLAAAFTALKDYYISKGYATDAAATQKWVESGNNYPKTLYAYNECGIPSIMIEQYIRSTMYGSDGQTNNDAAGIKNYVAELRLYIYAILTSEMNEIAPYDLSTMSYKLKKNLI